MATDIPGSSLGEEDVIPLWLDCDPGEILAKTLLQLWKRSVNP